MTITRDYVELAEKELNKGSDLEYADRIFKLAVLHLLTDIFSLLKAENLRNWKEGDPL